MKDAAIYAVGNGSVIAYGREVDWIQVFGSPYTIPTVFSLTPAVPVTAATERVPETNVWRHTCREGVLTDAAPRDPACLLRTWSLREPLLFTLDFHGFRADDVTALIEAIYAMIEQQQEACRVLIFQNVCPNVLRRMISLARGKSIAYWKQHLHRVTDAELEMLYTHLSNGLMHVVVEGYEKYSREEVVRFVNRIVQCSLSQFQ